MREPKGTKVKTVNIKLPNWPEGIYYIADKHQYANHRGVLKTRYKVIFIIFVL